MAKNQTTEKISKASLRNGVILALFALISTGLIALTHLITKDRIAQAIETALAKRLNQIVPSSFYDNDVYRDCTVLSHPELLGENELKAYRMRNQGKNYAVFITSVAPDGYAGKITLITGILNDGSIAGVRITNHQETPGLGDKIEIEKSDWITQFDGRSLSNTSQEGWQVKKDGGEFDALTGATITPRAIIKAVHKTLQFYQPNQQHLYAPENPCGAAH